MSTCVQKAGLLTGRQLTLMAVIGLHALVITALIAVRIVPPLIDPGPAPFEVLSNPPEVTPPPPTPAPKPVTVQRVEVVVPIIELPADPIIENTIAVDTGAAPAEDTGLVQVEQGAGADVVTAPAPARVFTELDYRVVKSPDEFYPATSVALQEQGVAVVRICVGPGGRIEGQPTIQSSSGYRRLDQAAIRWAREALRFTPATENGVGILACKGFRVVFNLN